APKFGFVSSIIPDAWLFKLKSLGSRSVKRRGTLNTPMSEPVAADQLAPFLPKTVQNCYKHTSPSGLPPSKPTEVTTPEQRTESNTSISRNGNQFLDDAYLTQPTSKRSFIVTPVVTSCKTPGSQITVSKPDLSHKVSPRRLSSSTNETTRGSRDPPWSFAYPSGTDTTNVSSFELGIRKNRSMWSTTSDSEATFNGETENGNVSDTQSVLRARILAAERLREGSNFSSREHKKKDNLTSKREESTEQLDSIKSVLEQRRQKYLLLEEEELQQACCRLSTHGSPALGAHNTP
ncbi:unnamed protein product, partial [Sphagnum jensenii]